MGEKNSQSEIKRFLVKIQGLPGLTLKSFLSWRDSYGLCFVRRPWKTIRLGYLYSNSISKHFPKILHRFQKAQKIWVKISRKVTLKVFNQNPRSSGLLIEIFCFMKGLLTVFLFLEDRGRPSDLDISTVTQYQSIFAKYFICFRKREKYLWKISRKVELNVFCQNPRSSGFPIEIFCFMTGFLRSSFC